MFAVSRKQALMLGSTNKRTSGAVQIAGASSAGMILSAHNAPPPFLSNFGDGW